jgi:hypothetical protein
VQAAAQASHPSLFGATFAGSALRIGLSALALKAEFGRISLVVGLGGGMAHERPGKPVWAPYTTKTRLGPSDARRPVMAASGARNPLPRFPKERGENDSLQVVRRLLRLLFFPKDTVIRADIKMWFS